jgi:hypothetical protein
MPLWLSVSQAGNASTDVVALHTTTLSLIAQLSTADRERLASFLQDNLFLFQTYTLAIASLRPNRPVSLRAGGRALLSGGTDTDADLASRQADFIRHSATLATASADLRSSGILIGLGERMIPMTSSYDRVVGAVSMLWGVHRTCATLAQVRPVITSLYTDPVIPVSLEQHPSVSGSIMQMRCEFGTDLRIQVTAVSLNVTQAVPALNWTTEIVAAVSSFQSAVELVRVLVRWKNTCFSVRRL